MALTEISQPQPLPSVTPRRAAIVLEIEDIDGVIADCQREGLQVHPEETLETHDGRAGREVGIVDYDGNLIVIYFIPAVSRNSLSSIRKPSGS